MGIGINRTVENTISELTKFRKSFYFNQRNYLFYLKIVLVILLPFIVYFQEFSILINEVINNEFLTHILLIPLILLYILYRKRKILYLRLVYELEDNMGFDKRNLVVGIILCVFSYFLKWYGFYTFFSLEIHLFSLPIFLSGLILILFNADILKELAFFIVFIFLIIPPPIFQIQNIGSSLSVLSSTTSYSILKFLNFPVELSEVAEVPVILLEISSGGSMQFSIDLACSGIYSLIGFLIFALFISYISRGSYRKKFYTLVIGIPIIYFFNIFRITLIVIIAYYLGYNIALNVFHLLGGWTFIFIGTIILIKISERSVIFRVSSFSKGTAISAAAEGVGARKSATKSVTLKSVSWPIAETIGILEAKTALATSSELNA